MPVMDTIVEIHIPLEKPPGAPQGSYPFPWIDRVEDFLADMEVGEEWDAGEEREGVYVVFVTGAAEADLLAVAARVAALSGVPSGVFAMVTDAGGEGDRGGAAGGVVGRVAGEGGKA
jgi:hypothetical protein